MSYSRYNYSSPSGAHSYNRSSYTSPSGNSRYSSTSSYDSSNYSTGGKYGGGLGSRYGSDLGGTGSGLSTYSSGLSNSYGGSLGNLSSRYGSGSTYTPGGSYTPRSSDYSSSYTSKYDSSSSYTPRTDYSSKYSRPTSSYDSDYTSKYSRPTSSYDSDYTSKYRSSDLDTSSKYKDTSSTKSTRKTRFADEEPTTTSRPKKSSAGTDISVKTSTKSVDTSEARRRRREKEAAEGSSPVPTRSAVDPVTSVTRKTESLSVSEQSSSQRPYSPAAAESARYQEQVTETPQYRPYTNPNIQSNSFKTLQGVIDSGRDPGSYFQKAPWQSTTVNQTANEPKKYTPSQTWAAVHTDGRNGSGGPGSYPARQAGPYQPPPPGPQSRFNAPPPRNQYTPPNYYNTGGAPKPFSPAGSPGKGGSPARRTELPHGDGVATKGKSSGINQQAADPDKIPVCAKCDNEVRGPFVMALNKSWCPNHFTCSKCDSELVNMGFVELNGKIYCENDYESFFAPKCAKCKQAIVGDTVNALEKTWHPNCFVCDECGNAISSGAFHVEEGRPYCMKDWQRLYQTKCTGCNYPVEPGDKWIEALEANWHSECFVCGVCRTQLEGQPFYPRDGKPFCKDHATA